MKSLDDMPHLCRLVAQAAEGSGRLSADELAEVQDVLEAYESMFQNKDQLALLLKLEKLEETNDRLEKRLNEEIQAKQIEELGRKKATTALEEAEEEIRELTRMHDQKLGAQTQVQVALERENEEYRQSINILRKKNEEFETREHEQQEEKQQLDRRLTLVNLQKDTNSKTTDVQIEELNKALSQRIEDYKKLNDLYKKGSVEVAKLKRNFDLLQQGRKSDARIIESLKNENKELKEHFAVMEESSKKRFDEDEKFIFVLVKELENERKTLNRDIQQRLEIFNKRKQVFEDPKDKEDSLLQNLGEFQMFENSRNEPLALDQTSFDRTLKRRNSGISERSEPLQEKEERIEERSSDKLGLAEEIMSETSLHKEPKYAKSSVPGFILTKEAIQNDLKKEIELRRQTVSMKLPEFASKIDSNEMRSALITKDEMTDQQFLALLDWLDDYLKSEKNQTVFGFQNNEKERLYLKFVASRNKSIHSCLKKISKWFLDHIHYMENKIKSINRENSLFYIKNENLKSELNHLLKTFLEKSKKNQDFMNELNTNFLELRKANKKKLQNFEPEGDRRKKDIERKKEYLAKKETTASEKEKTEDKEKEKSDKVEKKEDGFWGKVISTFDFGSKSS